MQLPPNYYHCFLGNGLDAVLVGPTGSMVADKVSVDRCNWYKSDRYYPEDKIVMVAGRWPIGKPLEHAAESGWYEAAPLGRTWYHLIYNGQPLELQASNQRFVPQEGTLYTSLDYGPVKGEAQTWVHCEQSLLIERYTFDQPVEFQAWLGPGVWLDEGWDTDPFRSVNMSPTAAEGEYDLGETKGRFLLRLDVPGAVVGQDGLNRSLTVRAQQITKYFAIFDDRQGSLDPALIDQQISRGYGALRTEHLEFWRSYFAASHIRIPDKQFQFFYDATMYHLKAMQNRVSGGLPVNNLRRTWSSHIFWDSYFLQHALLEANHRYEALEGCRFFQRTIDSARRHAREEFGCDGLKWDWEITHDGRKAYGVLLHQKYQIHNNGSYANQIWGYYEETQDEAMLREFYPILEGLAQFYLNCIVEQTANGCEIGYQVGTHESPIKVRNDGTNLAGTIVILRHCVNAARILHLENDFTRRCAEVVEQLLKPMDRLYNGQYFKSNDDSDQLGMSSIAPIYPMKAVAIRDPRAISTARAFIEANQRFQSGVEYDGKDRDFPWATGILALIIAWQGDGETAWRVIQATRPTICSFGGMTEVMENYEWNMQYFGTAQASVCTAIHQLLLQSFDDIHIFPALPSAWHDVEFNNLLAKGLTVSAKRSGQQVECQLKNESPVTLTRRVRYGDQVTELTLAPGETHSLGWTL